MCRRFHDKIVREQHESGSLIAYSEPSDTSHTPPKRHGGLPHRTFSITTSDPGAVSFDPSAAAPQVQHMAKSVSKGRSLQQSASSRPSILHSFRGSMPQAARQPSRRNSLASGHASFRSELDADSRSNSASSDSTHPEVTAAFIAPGKAEPGPAVLAALVQNSTPRIAFNSSPRHNHFEERHVFKAPLKRSPTTSPAPWDPSLLGEKLPTRSELGDGPSTLCTESSPDASYRWPSRANSLQDLDQGGTPSMHRWVQGGEGKSDGQGLSDPLAAVQPSPEGTLQDGSVGTSAKRAGHEIAGGGGAEVAGSGKGLSRSSSGADKHDVAATAASAAAKSAPGATVSSPTGKITAIKGKGKLTMKGKGWAALREMPLTALTNSAWMQAAETTARRREAASAAAAATSPKATTGRRIGMAAAAEQEAEAVEAASGGVPEKVAPDSPAASSVVSGASPKPRMDPVASAAAAKALRAQNAWKRAADVSRKLKVASAGISSDSNQVDSPQGLMPRSEGPPARGGVSTGLLSSSDKSKSAGHVPELPHVIPRTSNSARVRRTSSKGDMAQGQTASSPRTSRASGGFPAGCVCMLCCAHVGSCQLPIALLLS